jgi:hypothetical protein
MWIKYNYMCSGCNTIMEITTQQQFVRAPLCPCNIPNSKKPRVRSLGRHIVEHEIGVTPTFSSQSPYVLATTRENK